MKKLKGVFTIVLVILSVAIFSVTAFAAEATTPLKYFNYSIVDGEARIYRIDERAEGHIVIPETLGGCPVVEVKQANDMFDFLPKVTEITLPSTVKRVGELGLLHTVFEKVHVDSLETWLNIDFESDMGNPLSYANELYIAGELATDIVIPEGITEIKDYAFYHFSSIKSIKLPSSLELLGTASIFSGRSLYVDSIESWIKLISNSVASGKKMDTFGTNKSLYAGEELVENLIIPETITELPADAFRGFTSIKSVTFHENITKMNSVAFDFCENLKEVYVPDLATWFNVCEKVNKSLTLDTIYINNEPVVDLVIPEDIDTIPAGAFIYYSKLRSISLSSPIKDFQTGWNKGCSNFKAIYVDSYDTWMACEFENDRENPLSLVEFLYIDGEAVVDYVIPEGATKISDYAFCGYKSLKSITIPVSMEIMGRSAFHNSGLENVYVESLEAWINTFALTISGNHSPYDSFNPMNCAKNFYVGGELLVDVVIPDEVTEIPIFAFYKIKSIESVTFNSGIKTVKSDSFSYCSNLKEVFVPDFDTWLKVCGITSHSNVKIETIYIDEKEVVDFVIPEGITSLSACTFYNYDKLESITITGDVRSIGVNSFAKCDNLKNVYVDSFETWFNLEFKSDTANPIKVAENLYIGGNIVTDLVIPEHIVSIPANAFVDCKNIRSVTIHNKLTSIGDKAFSGCYNIESVYAPSLEAWLSIDFASANANPIHKGAKLYIGGELLEELVIPEGISEIKQFVFYGCKDLKSFKLPGEALTIGWYAFNSCSELKIYADRIEDWFKVDFNSNLAGQFCNPLYAGATLYIGGEILQDIVIPDTVELIPAFSLAGCKTIRKITIPLTVKIGMSAFLGCSISEIEIGSLIEKTEPVIQISSKTFSDCKNLKKITFGYGIKSIADNAFKDHTRLKEVVFLDGIEEIGEQAFYNTGITSLTIPSTVKTIGERAFTYCKSLESLTLGDKVGQASVTDIENAAFTYCTKLSKVTFNSGVKSMGEKVFYKSNEITDVYINDLVAYLGIKFPLGLGTGSESNPSHLADNLYVNGEILTDLIIPEGVTKICAYAFSRCETLKTVKFPSTLKVIEDGAFESCHNLNGVTLPESLEKIKESAFWGCQSITSINFGSNLKDIGWMAFEYCTGLEVIYMYPEQLDIGKSSFYGCNNIEVVLYTGTEEAWLKLLNENKRETGLENIAVFYSYRPESMLAPESFTAKPTANSVILNWTKINGVSGYRVFVKKDSGWKALTTTNKNAYTATQLQMGTKYTFAVKAYINTGALVLWSPNYSVVDTATPTTKPSKVTAAQNSSAIKLTWAKCSGATGYRIYFKSGNMWKIAVSTTSVTSHTFTGLKPGAKFTFAIRPYIINGSSVIWSPYTEFTTATMPSAVTAKASSPSKGSLSLSWNAVNGADGYRVYYKVGNGSYKLYKTYSTVQNLTFRNLKSGTKYTFAVRAGIRTSGGNIFGGYNTATVTVK